MPEDQWVEAYDIVQEVVVKTFSMKKKKKHNGKVMRPYKEQRRGEKLNIKGERKTIHI